MKNIILIFGLLFFSSVAIADDGWYLARTIQTVKIVVIDKDKEYNTEIYNTAISNLCPNKDECSILFWSNSKFCPTTIPMDDNSVNSLIASYYMNNGKIRFLQSCHINNDPHVCFN